MSQGRNLRSNTSDSSTFYKLDTRGKPVSVNPIQSDKDLNRDKSNDTVFKYIDNIDKLIIEKTIKAGAKPNFDLIAREYRNYLIEEKTSTSKSQTDFEKIKKEQSDKIIELENLIHSLNEKIEFLNSSILGEASGYTVDKDIQNRIYNNISLSVDQSPEELIKNHQTIIQNFEKYISEIKLIYSNSQGEQAAKNLQLNENINRLKEKITEQNIERDSIDTNMNVEPKDAIQAIPVFSGDVREFETFINTCDLYNQLVEEVNKPNLLLIIKAKIRGEALSKISPLDDCATWELLKTRLRDQIRKPVSYEYAQEDLCNVAQKSDESIEDYAKKVRNKLKKLNEASRSMANSQIERTILQTANEKLAISKFEQNIRNNTIRVLVSASQKTTLDEAIQIAQHKDLMEKGKNVKSCSFCGLSNHSVDMCRKKKNMDQQKSKGQKPNFRPYNSSNQTDQIASNSKNNDQQKNKSYQNNNNNNNWKKPDNNKNVRSLDQELGVTLQDVLNAEDSDDSTKN